jgi:hypothetical protein
MRAARPQGYVAKAANVIAPFAIWAACAIPVFGAIYLINLAIGGPALLPPGWSCDDDQSPYGAKGECYPMRGWHFEEASGVGRIAVHDITPTEADRQLDIDTARQWINLSNKERQEILDGKTTIYDFHDFHEDKGSN